MFEYLGGQSDSFHLGFGVGAIVAGVLLLKVSSAYKRHNRAEPLPPHLRFLQGEGMPQLVRIAGWIATLGGVIVLASAVALMLG